MSSGGLVLLEIYSGDFVTVLKAITSETLLAMQKGDCQQNEISLNTTFGNQSEVCGGEKTAM